MLKTMNQKGFTTQFTNPYQQWLMFPRIHLVLVALLGILWFLVKQSTPENHLPSNTLADQASSTSTPDTLPVPLDSNKHLPSTASRVATGFFDPLTATAQFSTTPTPIAQDLLAEPPKRYWKTYEIHSGDNLSTVFYRAGLSDRDVFLFISGHPKAKELTRMRPGQALELDVRDNDLIGLRFQRDRLTSIEYTQKAGQYRRHVSVAQPNIKQSILFGTIQSSLFVAAQRAGLDQGLIMQFATIFGWDIDFVMDIRVGDTFKVVFEEKYLDGEKLDNGDILAAEFVNNGRVYQAVRYINKKGEKNYFTPDGNSMRKAFLRSPLDIVRITSHFNLKRKHPVLNRIRAHKGTDYGAKRGTPIKAVGDGKIVFRGWKTGYGNVVYIDHAQGYHTRYAHMKGFKKSLKKGARVKQGDIIGYVGKTGYATGPHLHYEFHQNGKVRNPVTVKLPKATPIPKPLRKHFNAQTLPLLALLDDSDSLIRIASKEPDTVTDSNARARL